MCAIVIDQLTERRGRRGHVIAPCATAGQRPVGKEDSMPVNAAQHAGEAKAKGQAAHTALLSFGEEMEVDDAAGNEFSLSGSTHRK